MNPPPPSGPAETYEQYFVPAMFRPWAEILLRHAAPQPRERVLDIACGTGIVSREAARRVGAEGQVIALDMNPAMLGVARALAAPSGATIQWQEGNALSLPFGKGDFDLVLCQHGLQFFADRVAALREMHRVLAPGGRALVIVLQALARHPVFEALMTSVANRLALPMSAVTTPFALSDAEALRALFVSAGFKTATVVAETTMVRFPEPARFVPLAVASSAAAIPAFAQLEARERASLLEAVRSDVEPTLQKYREVDAITFPMFAHVAMATP
jgi:ubiquinone/menaquinone biosynthesis C-methylase UbiE